ncbi:MAG TPA: type IV pilin protein [Dyella sp.]|uniref:type IV pilin protein n=1 Tax=Dyella sp. TaxID=1869338 RepID=UPI002F923AEE
MKRQHGFSLIELLVVVMIIAVLAAIAVPAYSRYGFRARRADAQDILMRIANQQERYYATNNRYGALTDIGYSADPVKSDKGYYQVTLGGTLGANGATYTATATPLTAQAADVCGALSINNAGVKLPSATDTTKNANGNCW